MFKPRSEFLSVLIERGYLHQCTDLEALDQAAIDGTITAYVGYDATANSLHVGNLVSIMMLRRLQQTGHKPLVLMGGGTSKVGDPSGKDEARRMLTNDDIAANIAKIKVAFASYLSFEGPKAASMVNNADWLDALEYIPFLRDVGRHFSVNRMLSFDSVKLRLEREQPLSFLEFNYMILQAYDFMVLNRSHGCTLQMGGSDQWGNIVNGVELGRRVDGAPLMGLTTPLITTASGAKMGKTAAGAIWLSAERLSPYDYWQFWRNTDDADVARFMAIYTDLPMDEVRRHGALQGAEINESKKLLAHHATAMLHGEAAAAAAAETAQKAFSAGGVADDLPTHEVARAALTEGIAIVDLLHAAGLAESRGEAKRLVRGGGARLNDTPVTDENARASIADLVPPGVLKLSSGRKRHALVRPV